MAGWNGKLAISASAIWRRASSRRGLERVEILDARDPPLLELHRRVPLEERLLPALELRDRQRVLLRARLERRGRGRSALRRRVSDDGVQRARRLGEVQRALHRGRRRRGASSASRAPRVRRPRGRREERVGRRVLRLVREVGRVRGRRARRELRRRHRRLHRGKRRGRRRGGNRSRRRSRSRSRSRSRRRSRRRSRSRSRIRRSGCIRTVGALLRPLPLRPPSDRSRGPSRDAVDAYRGPRARGDVRAATQVRVQRAARGVLVRPFWVRPFAAPSPRISPRCHRDGHRARAVSRRRDANARLDRAFDALGDALEALFRAREVLVRRLHRGGDA